MKRVSFRHLAGCGILISLVLGVFAASLRASTTEQSLPDEALASRECRQRLMGEYRLTPASFKGDRLLAVAISFAVEEKNEEARRPYELFLQDHPNHAQALRGLGTVFFSLGQYSQAITNLNKAWDLGDADSLQGLAVSYLYAGRLDGVERLLPALLKRRSDGPDIVNCVLAYALDRSTKEGKPPDGALILQALEGLPDQEVVTRDDTGTLVVDALNRLNEANPKDPARRAIAHKIVRGYEADPARWPRVRLCTAGDAYLFLEDVQNAERLYDEALQLNPKSGNALAGLATVYVFQRKFQRAIECARKARELGDKDARTLANLAAAYVALRDLPGLKELVPTLVERKAEDHVILNAILLYCLAADPPEKELFLKVVGELTDEQILKRKDTTSNAIIGLTVFGEKERAERLLKLKKEQAKPKPA